MNTIQVMQCVQTSVHRIPIRHDTIYCFEPSGSDNSGSGICSGSGFGYYRDSSDVRRLMRNSSADPHSCEYSSSEKNFTEIIASRKYVKPHRHISVHRESTARTRSRKNVITRAAVLAAICVAIINLIGMISKASENTAPSEYKYYDAITVAYQQDLDDIVDEYCDLRYYRSEDDYIRELYRINNLEYGSDTGQSIKPGMHIVVPYYSPEIK